MTVLGRRRWPLARWGYPAFVALAMLVVVVLLEYAFWRYPATLRSTGTGPKANPVQWLGIGGARVFYTGMAVLFALLYVWVAVQGGRSRTGVTPGAVVGVAGGGLWLAASTTAAFFPAVAWLRPLAGLALVTLTVAAGAYSARVTGRRSAGGLAGFWAGITAGVVLVASIMAVDLLLASRLATSTWARDPACPQPVGDALKACAIGDDLGLIAVVLTMLPVLLAGAGALAGLGTAARTTAPVLTDEPHIAGGWRLLLIFMAIALTLFTAEIGFKLI